MKELSGSRCAPSGVGTQMDDRVTAGERVEVGRRLVTPALHRVGDAFGADVPDEGLAAADRVDLPRIDVETRHPEAGFLEYERQGQPDVALTDHPHVRVATADSLLELAHRPSPL
jgi:hypothetical protein